MYKQYPMFNGCDAKYVIYKVTQNEISDIV